MKNKRTLRGFMYQNVELKETYNENIIITYSAPFFIIKFSKGF
ncbi:hypothetical protein [Fusobacterium necrophorum]|nr:hypothetical protein [Fusobacterium necrophorum]